MSKTTKKKNEMVVAINKQFGLPEVFGKEGDNLSIRVGQRGLIAKCSIGDEKQAAIIYNTGKRVRIIVDNLWDDDDDE